MLVYAIDSFTFDLPTGHRFPLGKYRLLRERVEAELVPPARIMTPSPASDDQLLRAHSPDYLEKLVAGTLSAREIRRLGLPWSPQLLSRSRRSVGGTIGACRSALNDSIAVSLSGGTHHACSDHGQGFCVFNDVAVALRVLRGEGRLRRAVVLDCDVHQGNGTAEILAGDKDFFTFSIHGQNNFPFRKIPGSLDVGLPDGTGDSAYLEILEVGIRQSLALSTPDLIVYLAGADPFFGDRLGRLALTKGGLAERDRIVLDAAREAGVPVAVTMAGGYGRVIQDTVDIQYQTVRVALDFWLKRAAG